jgi:hypothetical protein
MTFWQSLCLKDNKYFFAYCTANIEGRPFMVAPLTFTHSPPFSSLQSPLSLGNGSVTPTKKTQETMFSEPFTLFTEGQ